MSRLEYVLGSLSQQFQIFRGTHFCSLQRPELFKELSGVLYFPAQATQRPSRLPSSGSCRISSTRHRSILLIFCSARWRISFLMGSGSGDSWRSGTSSVTSCQLYSLDTVFSL